MIGAWAKFEEYLSRTRAPRTAAVYLRECAAFERFRAGRSLDVGLLEEWAANLAGFNPQTRKKKGAAVRALLGWLARQGDADAQQAAQTLGAGYRLFRGPTEADVKDVAPVTQDEFARITQTAPAWGAVLCSLLWFTGARVGEVLGDPVAGIRFLTVADGRALAEHGFVSTTGKRGRKRTLTLPTAGREALSAWLAGLDGADDQSPLFSSPTRPAKPVSKQAFNEALHRAGVMKGAHSFRHAYRARLRKAGVSEELMQSLMGHGASTVTRGYGRPEVQELLQAVEALS